MPHARRLFLLRPSSLLPLLFLSPRDAAWGCSSEVAAHRKANSLSPLSPVSVRRVRCSGLGPAGRSSDLPLHRRWGLSSATVTTLLLLLGTPTPRRPGEPTAALPGVGGGGSAWRPGSLARTGPGRGRRHPSPQDAHCRPWCAVHRCGAREHASVATPAGNAGGRARPPLPPGGLLYAVRAAPHQSVRSLIFLALRTMSSARFAWILSLPCCGIYLST